MGPPPVSPSSILLTFMRRHCAAGEKAEAAALAKVAAPFVHPRAQASCVPTYLTEAADDELDFRCPAGGADAGA